MGRALMLIKCHAYTPSLLSLLLVLETSKAVGLGLPLLFLAEGLHRAGGELLVEVGDVCVGGEDGHEGSLDGPAKQRVPVHLLEPGVVADLVRRHCPQTVPRVLFEQAHQEVLELGGGLGGEGGTLGTLRGS
jgi:hypothetical protein